jgi:hypothetical protein
MIYLCSNYDLGPPEAMPQNEPLAGFWVSARRVFVHGHLDFQLKDAYEIVAEFPSKAMAGVSFVLVKGTKEGTTIVADQEHKLFIQSSIDAEILTEFYTITHGSGTQSLNSQMQQKKAAHTQHNEHNTQQQTQTKQTQLQTNNNTQQHPTTHHIETQHAEHTHTTNTTTTNNNDNNNNNNNNNINNNNNNNNHNNNTNNNNHNNNTNTEHNNTNTTKQAGAEGGMARVPAETLIMPSRSVGSLRTRIKTKRKHNNSTTYTQTNERFGF